jgi:hypothetical protein
MALICIPGTLQHRLMDPTDGRLCSFNQNEATKLSKICVIQERYMAETGIIYI